MLDNIDPFMFTAFATMRTVGVVVLAFILTAAVTAFTPKSGDELKAAVDTCTTTPAQAKKRGDTRHSGAFVYQGSGARVAAGWL